jgi:hypothetical protein
LFFAKSILNKVNYLLKVFLEWSIDTKKNCVLILIKRIYKNKMGKNKSATPEAVAKFILEHEGPDANRMGHPVRQGFQYDTLMSALRIVRRERPDINPKPYHFKGIRGLWQNIHGQQYAREVTGDLLEVLAEKKGWDLADVIMNIGKREFQSEKINVDYPDGRISFTALSPLAIVYRDSPSAAVLDWLRNNSDTTIREGYSYIKPWHFANVPNETWSDSSAMENGRKITSEVIKSLLKRDEYASLVDVIQKVTAQEFSKVPLEVETPSGVVRCTAESMLANVHIGSVSSAILGWIENHQDKNIREGYSKIRPWHFGKTTKYTWDGKKGKENAREVTGELIRELTKDGSTLRDVIATISSHDFIKTELEVETPDGSLKYNAGKTYQGGYGNSPSTAVCDWIKHNPNESIRKGYKNIKPWHFATASQGCWQGEGGRKHGREVVNNLINHLRKKNGWTLTELIQNITGDHFEEEVLITKTPEGDISYSAGSALNITYHGSPSEAILDWIQHHPKKRVRKGYKQLKPWHFGMSPMGTWEGDKGKENAREVIGEFVSELMFMYGWDVDEAHQKANWRDHALALEIKTIVPDGILKYKPSNVIRNTYNSSVFLAIADWREHSSQ